MKKYEVFVKEFRKVADEAASENMMFFYETLTEATDIIEELISIIKSKDSEITDLYQGDS